MGNSVLHVKTEYAISARAVFDGTVSLHAGLREMPVSPGGLAGDPSHMTKTTAPRRFRAPLR
jgi:hypothetical protein